MVVVVVAAVDVVPALVVVVPALVVVVAALVVVVLVAPPHKKPVVHGLPLPAAPLLVDGILACVQYAAV